MQNTIILSDSNNKKYLYSIDEGEKKSRANEIDKKSKPDYNAMDNEILAFVPAGGEDWKPPKKGGASRSIKKLVVNIKKSDKVSPIKHTSNEIISTVKQINQKNYPKNKLSKDASSLTFPESIGVRSKLNTPRKNKHLAKGTIRAFRNSKGYHASSGPLNFLKKKYKSEYLEVSCSGISNFASTHTYTKLYKMLMLIFLNLQ